MALVEPIVPKPAANDADRPRWIVDDVAYKVALSTYLGALIASRAK